ncbi:endocytosis [Pristimantis euphronides]
MTVPAETVTALVNGKINLPCSYTVQGGVYPMCWGQGDCTILSCNDQLIWTDDQNMIMRKSNRYNLAGNIHQGDMSLTITALTKDEGTYCCRVKVPGWFNDQRRVIEPKIENESEASSQKTTRQLSHFIGLDQWSPMVTKLQLSTVTGYSSMLGIVISFQTGEPPFRDACSTIKAHRVVSQAIMVVAMYSTSNDLPYTTMAHILVADASQMCPIINLTIDEIRCSCLTLTIGQEKIYRLEFYIANPIFTLISVTKGIAKFFSPSTEIWPLLFGYDHLALEFCKIPAGVLAVSEDVTGSVNATLTSPCTYTVDKDQYSFCWGQGRCPLWECNDIIV